MWRFKCLVNMHIRHIITKFEDGNILVTPQVRVLWIPSECLQNACDIKQVPETALMSLSAFAFLSIVLFYIVNVAKSLGSTKVPHKTLCIRKIITFLTWRRSFVGRVLSTKTCARNYERLPRLSKPNSKTKSHKYHYLHILHDRRVQCSIINTLHEQFSLQMNRYVS